MKVLKSCVLLVAGLLVLCSAQNVPVDPTTSEPPGLGFRPMPEEDNVESTLIWYNASDNGNVEAWAKQIDEFLKPYHKEEDNRVDCSFDSPPPEGKVCKVPMNQWGPCAKANRYNFKKKGPCIFLKLNKIVNWVPDLYNTTEGLPKLMPHDLKELISSELSRGVKNANFVWVSCAGESHADHENMTPISYYPYRGFPGYFFPFNTPGYLPPIVAVHFESPKTGVLINIECKAWAKNIHHDRADRRGSVHFELMVD